MSNIILKNSENYLFKSTGFTTRDTVPTFWLSPETTTEVRSEHLFCIKLNKNGRNPDHKNCYTYIRDIYTYIRII
jgi:hypothetical protein